MTDTDSAYILAGREAAARYASMAGLFDAPSRGFLRSIGVAPGWRCWDVGAGGGSIARWLGAVVGPAGSVLATDIQTDLIDPGETGNVTIERHDVVSDPIAAGGFDLIHTRLVLMHLPDPAAVIARLAEALAPGGWLVAEEFDVGLQPRIVFGSGDDSRWDRVARASYQVLREQGTAMRFGRRLPDLLRDAGLADVRASGSFELVSPAANAYHARSFAAVRDEMAGTGLATLAEIDAFIEAADEGTIDVVSVPQISAAGLRPR